jgi:hypothetical protein
MAQEESLNTMFHDAFVSVGGTSYALQVSGVSGGDSGSPIEISIPVAARATSIRDDGKAAAPGAGVNIAATAALEQGTWDIEISSFIGGTTVANLEIDNMEVTHAGVAYCKVINPVPGTTGATDRGGLKYRYDGAGVIAVRATAAATASSIYAATIIATRVN